MEETRRLLGERLVAEPARSGQSALSLRVALTSVLLVALLSHPAGAPREREKAMSPFFVAPDSFVEVVTADEKLLLDALRSPGRDLAADLSAPVQSSSEPLADSDESRPVALPRQGSDEQGRAAERQVARAVVEERVQKPQEAGTERADSGKLKDGDVLAPEEILRLLQVGQRPLQGDSPVVVIE
jgi:hypothetical protein